MWLLLWTACVEPTEPLPMDSGGTDTIPSSTSVTPGESGESAQWIPLSLPVEPAAPLVLSMDRREVEELLGPIATDIELLTLDPDVLLRSAVDTIRESCGIDWQNNKSDPDFDCSSTPLGATFGPDWQSTPEFAMVRLLTTTPANTDPRNTSLEGVANVANALGIGGGFSSILADTLERSTTDLAVGNDALIASIREGLLATHPNTTEDGSVPVTLHDALSDLATLDVTLGPAGDHPGIVTPSATVFGEVLGPDFEMDVEVDSQLSVLDGIDLSEGKGYLVLADASPPVSFDFLDPDTFQIRGLVDQPTVDLPLALYESPERAIPCTPDPACWNNLPGKPVNQGSVWSFDPWTIEALVADASRREHQGRVYSARYRFLFVVVVDIRIGDDAPGGWIDYDVFLDIGDPPTPQYLWELLLEVAQANLREWDTYAFEEGLANPVFALTDVATGLSAVDTEAAVRERLQAQSDIIADALFGDYRENSDPVDLFFTADAAGSPALQFVTVGDWDDDGAVTHQVPGFFTDEALTERVSVVEGGRESWPVPVGESVVYVQDDAGRRYRLDVWSPEAGASTIEVAVSEVAP